MTKKEIVKQISDRVKLPQLQTKRIVDLTFDAIVKSLESEGRIELRNFGVFVVKTRKARTARNPKTDVEVHVEAKNVVTFQPGKAMEKRVRAMPDQFPPKRRARKVVAAVLSGAPDDATKPSPDLPRKPR